jgi:hypothetical protein
MGTTTFQQLELICGTFAPQRTDDLKSGVAEWIGRRLNWRPSWIIEGGPYDGEWAMVPWIGHYGHEAGAMPPFAWVPQRDLSDIVTDIDDT